MVSIRDYISKGVKGRWDLILICSYSVSILLLTLFNFKDYITFLAAPILLIGIGYPLSFLLPVKRVFSGGHFALIISLSCSLSLGLTILISEALSTIIIASLISIFGAVIASFCRDPVHADKFSSLIGEFKSILNQTFRTNKKSMLLRMLVLAALILLIPTLWFIATSPPMYDGYTELYITGPDGQPDSIPRDVIGQTNFSVILGVVNHERTETLYEVQVWLIESSTADDHTDVLAAYYLDNITVRLPHVEPSEGGFWESQFETTMTFNLNMSGSFKLFFILSKDGNPELPLNPVPLENYPGYEIEDLINRARRFEVQSVNINLNISEPIISV